MNKTLNPWLRLLPLVAALVIAGCAMPLPPVEDRLLPATPAAFKETDGRWAQARPADAQPRGEWWKSFGDAELNRWVAQAAEQNTSIQQAAARLQQARALARQTDSARSPQVGVGAGVSRQAGLTNNGPANTVASVGVNLQYELDLFGRLSRASQAAELDAQSRAALLQSTRLLVQAETAQTYLALRTLDEERALVRDTVAAYRDTLRLTEARQQAGDIAELDVVRVRAEVAATEAEALALDQRRATLEHALAVLVGEAASSFQLPPLDWNAGLPVVPPGVPSTVLQRRPDVAAAQRSMLAAQARVGAAQAAWFPSVSLTGSAGQASSDLGDLFKWSMRSWGVGALLSLPVFDGGRRQAGVDSARAELDAALAGYREQVLVAFRDVEDQLAALRLLADQAEAQSRAVASASRATALSGTRWRNGYISQLDLLDAQRTELRNRRQALQVRAAQYQATVGLVRALGGSWDAAGA
ncbi:efflux transporter outer membrane subunit [Aquincola tertiaricarbonis]|uniref:Efflux transporter outer membrane subunit n=1 Tax=Aquincola tertiaricarbonis TaxID=391953 RepID=A0ABY4SIC9_AQUTE|nr:efflux transporter outer membrane subunit [Aquincola tertiaricarbonis]URI10746.1 efflux transporter outer membrane subunit [Aquincola tertiaricarbonis]